MFGFFKEKYNNPALLSELKSRQDRWFVFLDKLEARIAELTAAGILELQQVFKEDTDPYKRSHSHMLQGLRGQINHMRDKANDVKEENIISFMYRAEADLPAITTPAGSEYRRYVHDFRMACLDRYNLFDERLNEALEALQHAAGERDLESEYRQQLEAFEKIRDQFACKQCGGHLTIPKMFFIDTYVTCPFCQSQNTFSPSSGARMVLHNARELAEQRTAALRTAYENSRPQDPELYKKYLRAMFDEWNKIVPDMTAENEKFYQRLLEEYTFNHYK
ncbi:hypothetical protein HGH92_26885 [Chitinophaga varians]|uniref:Uncharacterized protein n=1 Tax=Chitinophaga varians TaxID=2202339 RepID=A0A847RQJ8_9BACT|nr:hypothetical protein [Chitinophaga varians]NLR67960.1 hypothetical protein [Chitinophaga varians]